MSSPVKPNPETPLFAFSKLERVQGAWLETEITREQGFHFNSDGKSPGCLYCRLVSTLHFAGPLFFVHCPQSLGWLLTFPSPWPISRGVHDTDSAFAEENGRVRKRVTQVSTLHPASLPLLQQGPRWVLQDQILSPWDRFPSADKQDAVISLILNEINRTLSRLQLPLRCSLFPIAKPLERLVYSHASGFLLDPFLLNPPPSVRQNHRAPNHQRSLLTPQLT